MTVVNYKAQMPDKIFSWYNIINLVMMINSSSVSKNTIWDSGTR